MKRHFFVLVLCLASGNGELSAQARQVRSISGADAEIQQILDDRVAERRVVGIVVELRDAQGVTHVYHAGSADKPGARLDGDSVFEIGSITKAFTSALLAAMVERGEVKLDDPVAKYLPATIKVPERGGKQITLVDLATHTSGLPFLPSNLSPDIQRSWAEYTDEEFYSFLSNYTLTRNIGEKFQYSDVGPGLLGKALALRLEMSWEQAVRERVIKPLGMSATGETLCPAMQSRLVAGHDETGKKVPNWDFLSLPGLGALRSSANDLMRFLEANLEPSDTELGRALALMQVDRHEAFNAKTHIGLAWFLGISADRNLIFHGGSTPGYNSFAGFDPVKHTAVVVLANSDSDVTDIGFHLLEASAVIDDDPPVVRELYKESVKAGFDHADAVVARHKQKDPAYVLPEDGVNSLGYRLLAQKRYTEAVAIFRLNVNLHPQSADAFDSLAEGYEDAGDTAMAIRNYERSLELNPKNTNAVEHLTKLRAKK